MSSTLLSSFFQFFTVALAAAILAYLYATYHYGKWKALGVPHTAPTPLFGHLADVIRGRTPMVDVVQSLYWRFDGHRFFGMYEARQPALVIREPELVHAIMINDFGSFQNKIKSNVSYVHDGLFEHLLNLRGDRWKAVRAKLTPTFSTAKLKSMLGDINECTVRLLKNLDAQIAANGDGIVDVNETAAQFTTDTIGRCAFGLECNALSDPNSEFRRTGRAVFTSSRRSAVLNIVRLIGLGRLLDLFRIRGMPDFIYDFFGNLLDAAMNRHDTGESARNDFISLLVKLRDEEKFKRNDEKLFSDNILAANAFVFFIAGFETTASAISYCLYEMALNRHVQDELRNKINRTQDTNEGQNISYDALKDMKYLDMVINEALRLHPPAPFVTRICTKKYTIPNSDIIVNVGDKLYIPIYSIHNDPKYHPNPNVFDPERFTEENKALRPHGTFLPFGDGPRVCIGYRFALMQVKIGLAEILTKFKVMPCKDTKIPIKIRPRSTLLRPMEPIRLKFVHIK